MEHSNRYNELLKIAGQTKVAKQLSIPLLRNKVNKKQIEKHFKTVKDTYKDVSIKYKEAKKKLEELQKIVDENKALAGEAYLEIKKISEVMNCLDTTDATDVKFDKNGQPIFYMRGGKLYVYDDVEQDLVPYKRNKSSEPGMEELMSEEELVNPDEYADDFSDVEKPDFDMDDDGFDEGFDVTKV